MLEMKYFVLRPGKNDAYGFASRQAIRTYAEQIVGTDPALAKDLRLWIESLGYTF